MKVRVASEFRKPLPLETVGAIKEFNGYLTDEAEAMRRALARKVFAKNGENPALDYAIQNLLEAKQADGRQLTLGFTPDDFTWSEIWREENYARALAEQTQHEKNDIQALQHMPAQSDDLLQARTVSFEDQMGELAEIKRRRRIVALGTAAFMNTPRYEGPGAPLNFIDPSDFIDHSVEAA